MRRLIINADELGLCASTNQAIEACHRFGTVTSTTVIVNMWDFDGAVRIARDNPRLGIGAHLNLTDGEPVAGAAAVPGLVARDGRFAKRRDLVRKTFGARLPVDEVRREWGAQLERLDRVGLRLTHLDCHEHVHLLPPLRGVLFDLARRRALPVRNLNETFVSAADAGARAWLRQPVLLKRWIRSSLFRVGRSAPDVPRPRTLVSFHGVVSSRPRLPTLADYEALLHALPADGVSEMMVHPGRADDTLTAFCADGREGACRREAEFALLMSPAFKAALDRADVRLETFATLQ